MSSRDRRVTLALKWHYLDHLDVEEIQDRFEREGIGSYARSTIRDYLNEKPKEEVLEAIEQENANVRLQAAERFERLFQEAREDIDLAVEDEPIRRVVPQTSQVPPGRDSPMRWSDWEVLDVDDPDRPEWATERDVVIRFTDSERELMPGEEYPVKSVDGSPKYTTEMVGLRRDQPDRVGRSYARQEAAGHLREKADVLGVYETDINLHTDGEVAHTVELDEETAATIREATLDDE